MHSAPFGRESVSRTVKRKEPSAYRGLVRRIVRSVVEYLYDDNQSQFSTFFAVGFRILKGVVEPFSRRCVQKYMRIGEKRPRGGERSETQTDDVER